MTRSSRSFLWSEPRPRKISLVYASKSTQSRQQINAITSFIDASQVYGNSEATARELRSFSGGRLRQAPNGLLPFNTASLPMEGVGQHAQTLAELRMAGDIRANEAPGLTAMHTLFVAEHNRLAGELAANHPAWGDERIFQRARKLVGAQMQVITYLEWLPALIGAAAPDLSQFQYRPETDPRISNEFATALFRIGHTMVSPLVMRMKPDYTLAENPSLSLAEAFFNPANLTTVEDYEYYLQGMAMQWHQEVDQRVIDPLRNALFGAPGNGGLDLAALNVQRGREHGLADYNSVRVAYGLPRVMDWSDISSDRALQAAFAETYGDINNVDLWPAALAEDRAPGSAVGELVTAAMAQEFTRLAEGDAFFFLWDDALSEADRAELEATSLADIIERNNSLQVQDNVFVVPQPALEMKKILARGDAGIELRFMSEPGYAYQIYYGESPDDTPTPLLPDALEPTTTVFLMECLDPHAFSAKERFYRIARQAVSEE